MLGPVSFHLKHRGEVKAHVQTNVARYRELDNRPGDQNPQADRVDLNSGEARTQVLLERGFGSMHVTERVQDAAGNVTFRDYRDGWLSTVEGFEVSRSANGGYSGDVLKYVSGWETSFHSSDRMSGAEASQQFNILEAQFQAEFAPKQ